MKPKQFFLLLCGIIAVVIIGGGGGYYLASKSLHDGTSQLSQKLADEELANNKLQQLQDLKNQYRRLQPVLSELDTALPNAKRQSELSLQLQNIAGLCGMTIKSVSFPPSTAPGAISQTVKAGSALAMPVTFQLQGSYDQLQTFLHRQELLNRYTSMNSLAVSHGVSGDTNLTFDIQLNAFLKP